MGVIIPRSIREDNRANWDLNFVEVRSRLLLVVCELLWFTALLLTTT